MTPQRPGAKPASDAAERPATPKREAADAPARAGAAATETAAPATGAKASKAAKATGKPTAKDAKDPKGSKPTKGGRKAIDIGDDFLIEGKLEKPNAFFILRRSQADFDWARLGATFSPLVLESVQDPLF